MEMLDFVVTVILVTASGALAPGPLFFANLIEGTKSGAKGGIVFAVAHTLVEFTLVMLLARGLLTVMNESAKMIIGVIGGGVLVAFGLMQIYGTLKPKMETLQENGASRPKHLLVIGLTLTGLNPFFIVWWLTAGAQLITISLEFASLAGVFFMYICHVWMDYVWLAATAYLAKRGIKVAGLQWYRVLIALFGAVLIYFGLTFLANSIPI